jgi:hypothetical protein
MSMQFNKTSALIKRKPRPMTSVEKRPSKKTADEEIKVMTVKPNNTVQMKHNET